ncbi:MAG: AAA domain-containing protein, partial [Paraprevotella sp.]|nr:AAA domain-containing protein [Paraprevotella sp.]
GKAEEYPYRHPRDEHRLQMALYKEILYYNLGRLHGQVQSFLFYSRYPQFYAIDVPQAEIRRVMALRNAILHLEHRLRNGASREVMEELDEAHLNVNNRKDRLYMQYLRPRLLEVLIPLRQMNNLESTYFHCFLTFMEREQFLAKVGDSRPDSSRGFAETWTGDTLSKQQNGNILIDLKLHPVTDDEGTITELRMELPDYGDDFLPNFRPGDMVMLYERHSERDLATNKQFFRCTVEEMQPDYLLLKLAYKQRNVGAFHPDSLYAVEPGYMDSTFNQTYSGLFGLLVAPKERKELLLGQRKPGVNPTAVLNRHYLNEEIDRIVLKAKQAEDYFLLVGPPGTGKTSVALKSMVEEFLSDSPEKTLLLMAYTNRAVDEICAMLSSLSPAPDYIRIGQELSCAPEFRSRLMQNAIGDATSRRQIYERLSPVRLFAGTVSSLCNQTELFSLKPVDIAIIDEASQVLEPQLLPLLCATTEAHSGDYNLRRCAIGKFILIGDHKQLPAVVVQRPETSHVTDPLLNSIGLTDCRNSLFERLHALSIRQETENIVEMLHRQGRMHPAISTFVNEKYYHGNLDLVPLRHQEEELKFNVHPEDRWSTFIARTRMGFISVMPEETEGNEKSNRNEAETVARLVETLYELFRLNKMDTDLPRHVGIIVPFRAQIAMIRKSLDRRHIPGSDAITVDTVERYQGSQRDVIIFSTTVSRFYQLDILSEPILIEGQLLDRKLNVALTRARKQFFLIGQEQLLRHCQAYREWLDYLDENQILRPLSDKEE